MNILRFTARYWLFIILAALAVLLAALDFFNQATTQQPPPSPTPTIQVSLEGISIGTLLNELKSKFPTLKQKEGVLYELASESSVRPHEIIAPEGKVAFVKRQLTTPKPLSELTSQYGTEEGKLYGEHSGAGFIYYAFPQKGVLLVGNPKINEVIEIWYFSPIPFDQFFASWGKDLTDRPSRQF